VSEDRDGKAMDPFRFGTSGWRGVLGEEITFERLRVVARASGQWLAGQGRGRRVLVGYDTRFASERMAEIAVSVLRSGGLTCTLSDRPVPTPVVASEILRRRAAGALVLTASHNPAEYHGMKVLGAWGGSVTSDAAARIEELALEISRAGGVPLPAAGGAAGSQRADMVSPYLKRLEDLLDRESLRRSRLRVVYDAMHGAGAGVLDEALARCGVRVEAMRGNHDPTFGGEPPDPVPGRLQELSHWVRRTRGLRIGLATDGDADRFGVVDETGRVLTTTQVLALLVDHLARRGHIQRGIAISVATGSMVEKVAAEHDLPVIHTPVGFNYLSQVLLEGDADAAGEQSGGFALGKFGREKDGILSGALMAERVAVSRQPLAEQIRVMEARLGHSACGSRALPATPRGLESLARRCSSPPSRVGGERVIEVDTRDGVRLVLEDGFLMLRASGTEPVIRIYAEARGPRLLARRLDLGEGLLRR
jgi:phosphoglucomutase